MVGAGGDGGVVEWWDGLRLKPVIGHAEHRRLIRAMLYSTVERLIDEARPGLVSMTTHTPNLPGQALSKFNDIVAIFCNHGFTGGRADSWHGRHIWMMDRA